MAPVPRLWIRSAEVRGEHHYENGITTTLPGGCIWKIIQIGSVASEEKPFENVEDGRWMDNGDYHLISSPGAFCSGELKKIKVRVGRKTLSYFFISNLYMNFQPPTENNSCGII